MADEVVGEAFVRIRPLVSPGGFAAESEGAVSAAGRHLGTVFAAAFAAVGVGELVKSVVSAAVDHQAAFAVLDRTVQDAGAANNLYGQSIESLLEKEARLKGFSDEDLASAFQRLVSVTHDSAAAFKDLQTSEDLTRFRHIDLATAALAVSKAEQGSTTSLQRYGLIVPKVTAAEDALRLAHDQAVASGAKLTAGDKLLYNQRIAQAQAADKLATREEALQIIQQRTGGTAATFAATSAGQFARLGVDLHQFKVAIGTDLLPLLTGAAEGLGAFLQQAAHSPGVMHEAQTAASDVGEAFHVTRDIIATVGPVLVKVADGFGGVARTVEILGAALVASKAVSFIHSLGGAQTAEAAAALRQTAAMTEFTAALEANTAALTANDTALAGSTAIYSASGGVLATVATEETAVGTQAVLATAEVETLRGRLAGLAAIGAITIAIDLIPKAKGKEPGQSFLSKVPLFGGALTQINKDANAVGDAIFNPIFGKPSWERRAKDLPGIISDVVKPKLFPSLTDKSVGQTLAGVTGPPLADEFAAAAARAAKDPKLLEAGKTAVKSIAAGVAQARNDLQNAYLAIQQDALNTAGDQITSWYDIQSAKLLGRTQELQRRQSRLTLEQDLLSQAQARKTVSDLRHEVLLPGGHQLSPNNQVALRQLNTLERRDQSPALADFILQFRQAILGVQQGKLGIAQGRLGLEQEALDQQKQREQTALGLQQDSLKLAQDAQSQRNDQLSEAKKQTSLLKDIKKEAARRKFVSSLERNPGGATKRQKVLAGVSR